MTNSSGRLLPKNLVPRQRIENATLWDLGCTLLHQLHAEPAQGSYLGTQQHLRLFNVLSDELRRRADVIENRLAPRHLINFFGFTHYCTANFGLPMAGAVYLDVGCGSIQPFGRMFAHVLAGARTAYCLELDPVQDPVEAVSYLARVVEAVVIDPKTVFGPYPIKGRDCLANIADFDLARLAAGDPGGVPEGRLVYLQRSATDTGLPDGSVDVVVSNSFLEHVPDADAVLAELARVTKPGGYALHGIDASDHRWYARPELSRLEYLTVASNEPIVFECNRLRIPEFERLFDRHGFDVKVRWPNPPVPIPPELRERLQPPWRDLPDEELNVCWCSYMLQKR